MDLLDLIQQKLLRMNPEKRAESTEIVLDANKIYDSCKDVNYCTKKTERPPKRKLTELSEFHEFNYLTTGIGKHKSEEVIIQGDAGGSGLRRASYEVNQEPEDPTRESSLRFASGRPAASLTPVTEKSGTTTPATEAPSVSRTEQWAQTITWGDLKQEAAYVANPEDTAQDGKGKANIGQTGRPTDLSTIAVSSIYPDGANLPPAGHKFPMTRKETFKSDNSITSSVSYLENFPGARHLSYHLPVHSGGPLGPSRLGGTPGEDTREHGSQSVPAEVAQGDRTAQDSPKITEDADEPEIPAGPPSGDAIPSNDSNDELPDMFPPPVPEGPKHRNSGFWGRNFKRCLSWIVDPPAKLLLQLRRWLCRHSRETTS